MAGATFLVPNFLGGEISQFAQGRVDRPDYKVSLNVCLNSFPIEIGACGRRPGTMYAGHTRGGAAARVAKFDFEQAAPVTMEFTDAYLRFRNGAALITTNDTIVVATISTATPAVIQTYGAHGWSSGSTVVFSEYGNTVPPLQNRQLVITVIDTTHFSIADAITGAAIDGTTVQGWQGGTSVSRVLELTTAYVGGIWSGIRIVQAETTAIILQSTVSPQALSVTNLPAVGVNYVFAIATLNFLDGPYLDPVTNGAQLTPGATKGVVNLTLAFPAYDSAKAYKANDFVTSASINYVSIIDQNVGNTPAISPSAWTVTSASAAVNNGQGFLGTDVGRLIRLLSEPLAWSSASTYTTGAIVSYNPSGLAGASTYWASLVNSNTNHIPGADTVNWSLVSNAFLWSWGKIVGLSNLIDRALAGSSSLGSMSSGGGLNASFDGNFNKNAATSSSLSTSGGFTIQGTGLQFSSYVGKNYSGASDQKIMQATVYPSTDRGFTNGLYSFGGVSGYNWPGNYVLVTLNLRAKATAPSSSSDGTLLGSSGAINNSTSAVSIVSNDQVTAWKYVWVEMVSTYTAPQTVTDYTFANEVCQLSLFNPPGAGVGTGVSVEILGPALLNTNAIQTWRLGVYSNTTGFPTCGCWDGGRLYLGGAVSNRWDASVSNGINGSTIDFAPTSQYGAVAISNAISYTFNSDSVNPILWMSPELQGIVMGTLAGEWLVQAPTAGPISPTNVSARRVTKIGCANIEPRRTEHTTIFVKRYARKLMEYFADVYSGKYSAPNLADKAQHITAPGVAELAYTEAVDPILWGRDEAGALFGVTYKRDSLSSAQGPTFYAWHRHTLGSGRVIESICSGPSTGGDLDALTMITNDATTGVRHVEILTDTPGELTTLANSWFLDDAVHPTSVRLRDSQTSATFEGLWHLNGKTVQIFAGGLDLGDPGEGKAYADFVVANGAVTVDYGDGVSAGAGRGLFTQAFMQALDLSEVVIGFTYNSDGQLVRRNDPAETGARNGPALGKKRRNHRYALQLVNTRGISVGCTFDAMYPADFKGPDDITSIGTLETFTGIHQDALQDDYSYDGMVCWRIARPYPATIVAIAINTATQDQ